MEGNVEFALQRQIGSSFILVGPSHAISQSRDGAGCPCFLESGRALWVSILGWVPWSHPAP
eukprot:2345052-Ditylum_brightwellii.AAC.1